MFSADSCPFLCASSSSGRCSAPTPATFSVRLPLREDVQRRLLPLSLCAFLFGKMFSADCCHFLCASSSSGRCSAPTAATFSVRLPIREDVQRRLLPLSLCVFLFGKMFSADCCHFLCASSSSGRCSAPTAATLSLRLPLLEDVQLRLLPLSLCFLHFGN